VLFNLFFGSRNERTVSYEERHSCKTENKYSVFQSAEVQKLWVLGKGQEAKGSKNGCTSLA